ncbi:MAG: 30S ribosomal protein S16 [bacterium]|nr:30S ribosomal protein S16 [bacterium]
MVIIRLRRQGRSHDPHYRLVAQEKRSKLNGQYIEAVGHYHPTETKNELVIHKERVDHWLGQGAQLSDTVVNLLVREGLLPKERKISRVYSLKKKETKQAKAEGSVETPAAADAKTTPVEADEAETPVEEVKAEAPTEAVEAAEKTVE